MVRLNAAKDEKLTVAGNEFQTWTFLRMITCKTTLLRSWAIRVQRPSSRHHLSHRSRIRYLSKKIREF